MDDPFIVGPADPLEDDPVESFKSMDKEIEEAGPGSEIGAPVPPCKPPHVEVWLLDTDPSPVPDADCKIGLPTGKSRSGKLDQSGYLYIENFELDDPDLDKVMALGVASSGNLEINFMGDAPVAEEVDEGEPDIPEEPPLYFKPPFGGGEEG
jgi:hypothetical protein